jgi:hypothetical protein
MASGPGFFPDYHFNIGGVFIQVPHIDPNVPYASLMRNISVCIAIQKMAETISDENLRIALSNAAAQALKEAVHHFATEASSSVGQWGNGPRKASSSSTLQ